MVRLLAMTLLLAALTGCSGKSYKVEHPVVGPVPPRIPTGKQIAMADDQTTARGQSGDVQLVSMGSDKAKPLEMTDVVATVNGKPILVASVLGPMRTKVEAIRKQVPPTQFRQIQEQAIREQLPSHIEQAMMVAVMETKLKTEQAKAVNTQIDALFQKQLDDMVVGLQKQEDKLAAEEKRPSRSMTVTDLEADIQKQGMTLHVMRKMFGDKAIAQQYMMGKLEKSEPIGRQELLAAYHERVKEFSEPAAVKWQQIQVSYRNFGDKAEARQQAEAALSDLHRGVAFTDVAKKYSDGPDAAEGGNWDFTQYESLLTELQEPMAKLPPKTPSPIIATANSLQIVQVVERREIKTQPFEDVQERIREDIAQARHKTKIAEIMKELKSECVVTTIFDDSDGASPASPAANKAVDKAFSSNFPEGG